MINTELRTLSTTDTKGLTVPALGIGTWSWGDTSLWGYGQSFTREDITQAYRTCLDAGLNFFDTAEIYGRGESERILGTCRREDGRPIIIASKFMPMPARDSTHKLLDALDQSLQRLGVESLDLYQIHWPIPFTRLDTLMDGLAEAVRSGKIRAVGVSNFSASQMRRAYDRLDRHGIPLASNQVYYNLLHRNPETNGVLAACRELDVALIAYSPLAQGILTGKFRTGAVQMPLARRLFSGLRTFQPARLEPLFHVLESVAQDHGKTLAQVSLNWLIAQDEHIIPIPGAKNARQAQENAGALGWHMTEEQHARISQAAHV